MQPLVSICIPTFNRANYLKQTLDSIVNQSEFLDERVEVVVFDNGSIDKTHEVCNEYMCYSNFFYHRISENIGSRIFPIILSEAHGKLRKLNNDTFILKKNSLKYLCDIVDKYDENRPFISLRNRKDDNKELNFHDFVIEEGYWVTWIGKFMIWEDECDQIQNDFSGCELDLWQVKKSYELAHKKDSVVIYSADFGTSISPQKKDLSYGLFKVFYCNYMKILNTYIENGSLKKEDVEIIEKELLFKFFLPWMISVELNNTDMIFSKEEDLKTEVYNQYKNKSYWDEFKSLYEERLLKEKLLISNI